MWYLHTPSVTVGPVSAVNDLTVTEQVNSGKSCLEEVSQLLIYQVALKTKNSFVSIVGFVELLLLFLSIAAK